jgi:hypothetical protein|tara:strand:- start:418 stop:702 length:285 start_codon:yes stop_codon:yes gene_type:complete
MKKKMTSVWHAPRIRQGEKVYVKTMPGDTVEGEHCYPDPNGLILCQGKIMSVGIDSEWDSLIVVRFEDPLLNDARDMIISEDEKEYHGCFYVER